MIWVDSIGTDVTLCFISSQNLDRLTSEELLLDKEDPEFQDTGLKVSSKVRVTKIATIDRSLIKRRLGKLGTSQVEKINAIMLKVFQIL